MATDERLAKLKAEVAAREAQLTDPKRQEVVELYGKLDRILDRLAELGEDVTTHDGDVISIVGTRFSYLHGLDLTEK